MAGVWMRHPDLPEDQLIEAAEQQVPHYQSSGWEVTDAPQKPAPNRKTPALADGGGQEVSAPAVEETTEQPAPEKTARRRTPKEGEK